MSNGQTEKGGPNEGLQRLSRQAIRRLPAWKVEDAKARFSEVVRKARTEGPQRVTHRGKDAVVVIAIEQLEQLLPDRTGSSLIEFLQSTGIGELEVVREEDRGRDIHF